MSLIHYVQLLKNLGKRMKKRRNQSQEVNNIKGNLIDDQVMG